MSGIHWLTLAIGIALGYLVLPMLLSLIGGKKQSA